VIVLLVVVLTVFAYVASAVRNVYVTDIVVTAVGSCGVDLRLDVTLAVDKPPFVSITGGTFLLSINGYDVGKGLTE
jgi:hypothetical protein